MEFGLLQKKKSLLSEAFSHLIEGYIIQDLEVLMNVPIKSNGYGGCTIPAAMTIVSAMEFLGTYSVDKYDINKGREYLLSFIETYISEISEDDRKSIVFNYRHKMMHTFFPNLTDKKSYAITKKPQDPNVLFDRSIPNKRILNVPLLYRYFLKGFERLKTKVFVDNDETIINALISNFRIEDKITSKYPTLETFNTSSLAPNTNSSTTTDEATKGLVQ